MTDGGVNTCKCHQYHAPNKTKPIEYQSRLWALVGGVDIPLQILSRVTYEVGHESSYFFVDCAPPVAAITAVLAHARAG